MAGFNLCLVVTVALACISTVSAVKDRTRSDARVQQRVFRVLDMQADAATQLVNKRIELFTQVSVAAKTMVWLRTREKMVRDMGYLKAVGGRVTENVGDLSEIEHDEKLFKDATTEKKLRIHVWNKEMMDASVKAYVDSGLWAAQQKKILSILYGIQDTTDGEKWHHRTRVVHELLKENKASVQNPPKIPAHGSSLQLMRENVAKQRRVRAASGDKSLLETSEGAKENLVQALFAGTKNTLRYDLRSLPTLESCDCSCHGQGGARYKAWENKACRPNLDAKFDDIDPELKFKERVCGTFSAKYEAISPQMCAEKIRQTCIAANENPDTAHMGCEAAFMWTSGKNFKKDPNTGAEVENVVFPPMCLSCPDPDNGEPNDLFDVYLKNGLATVACCGHSQSFQMSSYHVDTELKSMVACDSTTNGGYGCAVRADGKVVAGVEAKKVSCNGGCCREVINAKGEKDSVIDYNVPGCCEKGTDCQGSRSWSVVSAQAAAEFHAEASASCSKEEKSCEFNAKVGASARASAMVETGGEGFFKAGDIAGEGRGKISATVEAEAQAEAEVAGKCDKSGCTATAEAKAEAKVEATAAADASGKLTDKDGNTLAAAEAKAGVTAEAHASAEAKGTATFTKDKTDLEGTAGAVAGASVSAGIGGEVESICGMKASGSASVSAGAQAGVALEGGFKRDGCTLSVSQGGELALLGGVKYHFSLSIDPCCLAKKLFGYILKAGKWVVDAAKKIWNGAKDAMKAVARKMGDIAKKAGQAFKDIAHGVSVAAKAVGKAIVGAAKAVANGAKTAVKAIGTGLKVAGKAVGSAVKSAVKSVGKVLRRF